MRVKMYMRPEQMKRFKSDKSAYASTFRDHDSCFEIEVDCEQIDMSKATEGMPCNNYLIRKIRDTRIPANNIG